MDGFKKSPSTASLHYARSDTDYILTWIPRHTLTDALRYCKHHGSNRSKDAKTLLEYDVILTTYATLTAEFRSGDSILHQAEWFRLVLDEGMTACSVMFSSFLGVMSACPVLNPCSTRHP